MIMQLTLSKYPYEIVRRAFEIHIQNSSEMPKPADIVKIIDPPKQARKWCAATFIEINKQKRHGVFITDAEKKYCEDFMAAKIAAPEEERGLMEDAIKQVESDNKQYYEGY